MLFHYLLSYDVLEYIFMINKNSSSHDQKIANMTFASVYPHYVNKVIKKGRTEEELLQVISWLTSYDKDRLMKCIEDKITFDVFFENCSLNPKAMEVKGQICGYKIEEILNPLTQKVRILDKLVDELAKGRKMDAILRK